MSLKIGATVALFVALLGIFATLGIFAASHLSTSSTVAANDLAGDSCNQLPDHGDLAAALAAARATANGGFDLDMWGTIVNRDGIVCAVAFTGGDRGDQWPGSRVISAQKANTANSFSLPGLALSTANLFSAVQPGGSLFGLQESNPVNTDVAYKGNSENYGQSNDPMVGGKIGGVNVFGGGLALYGLDEEDNPLLLGGIGVSGDSSCADHNIAWKTRDSLNLDNVPGGINPESGDDNIVYDTEVDPATGHTTSPSGWGHPDCSAEATTIGNDLPIDFPIGPNS
jgi:uncharacterized protein GlcG (DUF336 family)